jgi:hypothetical protein
MGVSPGRGKDFALLHSVQTCCESRPVFYVHSATPNSDTSSFKVWCLIHFGDNFYSADSYVINVAVTMFEVSAEIKLYFNGVKCLTAGCGE